MKNQSQAVRAGTIAKVIALALFLGGAGVGYVFQQSQIYALTEQLKEGDATLEALELEQRDLRRDVELMTSPTQLEQGVHHFQLGLVKPHPRMVRTRREPPLTVRPRDIELVGQP